MDGQEIRVSPLLTAEEVAEHLRCSVRKARQLMQTEMKAIYVGVRGLRVSAEELARFRGSKWDGRSFDAGGTRSGISSGWTDSSGESFASALPMRPRPIGAPPSISLPLPSLRLQPTQPRTSKRSIPSSTR